MTLTPKPSTGLALSLLVPSSVRTKLNWRKAQDGRLEDESCECMFAQIGPGSPYRLLVLSAEASGLIRLQVWKVCKQLKVEVDRKVLSDLLEYELLKVAAELNLS
jgi:hypothetical protein